MRFFLSVYCFFISIVLSAQAPFSIIDSSNTWKFSNTSMVFGNPGFPYHTSYSYLKIHNDTIINNIEYKKITDPEATYNYFFIRQQNDTIFCRYPQYDEFILYDFSLQEGDTFYSPSPNDPYSNNSIGIVNEVDSLYINGFYFKTLNIYLEAWHNYEMFIENIGSSSGLLYNLVPWVDNWKSHECFSNNDTIYNIYSETTELGNCFKTVGIDVVENELIDIYPNPSSTTINWIDESVISAKVFSMSGRFIEETQQRFINISKYNNGIYFILLEDKYGNKSQTKFYKVDS